MALDPELVEHLMTLQSGQTALATKIDNIDRAVNGNGQPGLAQKVEELQASKNRMYGLGAAITFLSAVGEWLLHRR